MNLDVGMQVAADLCNGGMPRRAEVEARRRAQRLQGVDREQAAPAWTQTDHADRMGEGLGVRALPGAGRLSPVAWLGEPQPSCAPEILSGTAADVLKSGVRAPRGTITRKADRATVKSMGVVPM